jgi:hypothetical protein
VTYTTKPQNKMVEVVSYKSLMREQREKEAQAQRDRGVIVPPSARPQMPDNLREEMGNISMDAIRLI